MAGYIRKQNLKYDIYHSHYWDAGYVAMKLSETFDHFFVHTFHSLGAWKREHMGGNRREMEKLYRFTERIKYERMIFKKTKALIMTSAAMVNRSRALYGYRKKNYVILPAGVNTCMFRPLKNGEKERMIDVPQNYLFWVGRFDTNKGLDYLLRAFAQVAVKEKDLFLVIGGGSKHPRPKEKKLRKYLLKIVNSQQIAKRVFFTHHIKDRLIPSYYRKAKFFVLPSKFEPFGMTAAEAMACGTALIASKRAGIVKYLKNRHNCLVVNPYNKKDLGWAIRVLNRNYTFRRKIAKNGLMLAQNEFSWTVIAQRSLDYYTDLINE
jgi:mannosylfructose-phosphate synthase